MQALRFFKKLQTIDIKGLSSMKIRFRSAMNMGVYSQKVINQFETFLLSKKNVDSSREKLLHLITYNYAEDFIFENDPTNKVLGNNCDSEEASPPIDYYGNGVLRIVEYYPLLDLYKMKSNWCENRPRNLEN